MSAEREALASMSEYSLDTSRSDSRTVLVTGGAGFIGSHLVEALMWRGCRVRVIDNFATGTATQLHPAAELIKADIRQGSSIADAFKGVDCVFHVAALPRVPLSIEKPLDTHMVNVVGALNVLLAARDAGVRRVVYSSSSSVYGNQAQLPLHEEMKPNPLNPYALQKLAAEQYTQLFHHLYGMETFALRYFNVFGPRMATEGAYVTVISAFLRARLAGQPLTIHGDGEQTRDFTHVRDVVSANILAMDALGAKGIALNIGQGRNVSINWIAEKIGGPRVNLPARRGDARDTLADNLRAREVLGWRPQVTTEEGLIDLVKASGL
jgi:nucleoside-diphosphate-sugar epimerase